MKIRHRTGPFTPPGGEVVAAIFPVIVSASRATDLPAFHAAWFMDRLRAGFVRWVNRFNPGQVQYVAFRDTRVIVFWTKNPEPLLPHLDELDRRGLHYYVQYTLNDYEAEGFEPGLPALRRRLDTFKRLAERVGPERVIWRFDPAILTASLSVSLLLDRIGRLGEALHPFTRKLVFSFADIGGYRGVCARMRRAGIPYVEFAPDTMREFAAGLACLNRAWGLQLATCAEAIELTDFGIMHNRCIDGELMIRLWPDDAALVEFLGGPGAKEGGPGAPAFAELRRGKPRTDRRGPGSFIPSAFPKDPGQRALCGCIVSKDIGAYGTCVYRCVYCYANGAGG